METKKPATTKILTMVFGLLSVAFILAMALSRSFFEWTFARHQNVLSWYIRPLFILPICFFAYRRSGLGISVTVFLLLSSMFWFPEPAVVNTQVQGFLDMEKEYLTSGWTFSKAIFAIIVFGSLTLLALAFWKRSLKTGLGIIAAIALGKVTWSVVEGGDAGKAVILPAAIGLVICLGVVYYFIRRSRLKSRKEQSDKGDIV